VRQGAGVANSIFPTTPRETYIFRVVKNKQPALDNCLQLAHHKVQIAPRATSYQLNRGAIKCKQSVGAAFFPLKSLAIKFAKTKYAP